MKTSKALQTRLSLTKPLAILGSIASVATMSLLPMAQAQMVQFLPTPPDQGTPDGRQRGGATRGDCLAYQGLTALVPEVDGVVWSQTTSETPRFFFKIPAALTESVPLEFVIQDSDDNYAFNKQFSLNAPAGILEVPVTPEGSGLTPGENYTWTFSIYCDAARPSASVSVSGTLSRVTRAGMTDVGSEASPEILLAQIQQYAALGVWHEALGLAFDWYRLEPTQSEPLETLETLLQQAELVDVAVPDPGAFIITQQLSR